MEFLPVSFDDKLFDKLVHSSLPEGGDMQIAVKDAALVSGRPGFVVSFTVMVGKTPHRVQAVNTVRNLLVAMAGIAARYPELCRELGLRVSADYGDNPLSGPTHPN